MINALKGVTRNFGHKVKLMRDAQIKYFRSRDSRDLKEAKQLEAEVDNMLKGLFKTLAKL